MIRNVETTNHTENLPPLQDVNKDVITALSLDKYVGGLEDPSMDNNASFMDFVSKLFKSGSDKGFMHQKKYQKLMEPILEEQEQPIYEQQGGGDGSIDMVDYDSSDTEEVNQAGHEEGEYIHGAVLALAAPSLEHERMDVVIPVDGSQPEVENMQENMQEVLTQEDMRGNDEGNAGRMEIRAEDPVQPTRMSTRITGQPHAISWVEDGTRTQNHARNVACTNLNSFSKFDALDDEDIYARALETGVKLDTFNLDRINHIKDLEVAASKLSAYAAVT
jgi:hypothetical protein